MKKSLIALTLATLPVAAMADVTLYGQIKAGVEISKVKLGEQTAAKLGHEKSSKTATEIADFGSRIGFKGHEHLGNNLNAIGKLNSLLLSPVATKSGPLANLSSVWKVASVKFVLVNWTLLLKTLATMLTNGKVATAL